ncbi:MAG: BatD family protein [Candidatus Cryptobacteroides sp.]
MRKLLTTVAAVMIAIAAGAQTMRVEAPNVVAADEQFNVTFIIEGEDSPSDFEWNPGGDFRLVWGPQSGRSTSIQFINGKRTKSSQFTYTYILLPLKSGTFTLPEATAKIKGKQLGSGNVSIEVVSGGQSSGQQQSQPSRSTTPQRNSAGTISDDDLFLRLTLSRTDVVVGEPVTATLKLYQRVNVAGFEDARFPSFNGFWSQETEAPTNIEFRRENYNDMIYNTAVLRKYVLIPQQSGPLTIDPAELVCLVNIRVTPTAGASIFDGFFDDYRTIRKRIATSPVRMNVRALPSGAPASFGGGVGVFSITSSVNRDSLLTHEAASLSITVKGSGNVSLLEAPKVNFPPDMEVYDVKTTRSTDKAGISGSITFEYPFIPRSHGDFTIEPVQYSYYDINSGKYVTLQTKPVELHIAKSKDTAATVSSGVPSQQFGRTGVKSLNEDIRFIRTKVPVFSPKGKFLVLSPAFWIILALIVIVAVILWVSLRKLAVRRADVVGTRNRKANKMARKRLQTAGNFLKQNLYSAFYEELHKAVLGYVSDKMNISVADLSKETVSRQLTTYGVEDSVVARFVALLDACEFARYSPDAGHEAMQGHYEEALNVISTIDSQMKNVKHNSGGMFAGAVALLLLAGAYQSHAAVSYPDSLWNAASAAYAEGRWEDAANTYKAISAAGLESPSLYCNIGDACFKGGDYPAAILNYERALKLDPSYSDARYNLEIAKGLIQDRIDPVPEFILKSWMRSLCYVLDSDSWAIIFIVLAAVFAAMILLFVLGHTTAARKAGFFTAIAVFLLAGTSLGFSLWQRSDYMNADSAIVMRPVTPVKSSPSSESATDLFILHEGTKVRIIDQVGLWSNIELADGRQGWMLSSDMEII